MTKKQSEKLLELYNNYILKEELRKELSEEELEKERVLGLMYTTLENDAYEIQVSYNLENYNTVVTLTHYKSGREWVYTEPESIEEFLNDLEYLKFDDWYAYAHQIVEDNFVVDLNDDAW